MRCEHQSVVVCESFGLVSRLMLVCSPALLEAEALSVHLQDMDMVSKAGPERAGQAFRSKDLGPLVEGQVGGDQSSAPLVALTEDLEQQFRQILDRGTKPSSSMISSFRPASRFCNCNQQMSFVSGLNEFVQQSRGGGEFYAQPLRQAARPSPRAIWVLPVPLLPRAMMFSLRSMHSQRAKSNTRGLFRVGSPRPELEGKIRSRRHTP